MITVSLQHNFELVGIQARVQTWLDYNWMWAPKARINGLKYRWKGTAVLELTGTAGLTKYKFMATFVLTPLSIAVTASDPSTAYIGAKKGWLDELQKIVGIPKTLPPRLKVTVKYPAGVTQASAKDRIDAGMQALTAGQQSWRGNNGFFFVQLKGKDGQPAKPTLYGESQAYCLVTLKAGQAELETRPNVGAMGKALDPGAPAKQAAYGKQWETMLAKMLGASVKKLPAASSSKPGASKGKARPTPASAKGKTPALEPESVETPSKGGGASVETPSKGGGAGLVLGAAAVGLGLLMLRK